MTDKLRECPFCGGEAEAYDYESEHDIYDPDTLGYVDTEYYTKYGVGCVLCGCIIAEKHSEEEAIKAWNTRKPMDRIVEQLERLPNVNSDYWNSADLIDREDAIEIVKGGAE